MVEYAKFDFKIINNSPTSRHIYTTKGNYLKVLFLFPGRQVAHSVLSVFNWIVSVQFQLGLTEEMTYEELVFKTTIN